MLEHCKGHRLAAGHGIRAGLCPSRHLLGIVAWLGSSVQDLEMRNVQSPLVTPQCALPLLTGAGDETQDSGLVWASCFSSGSCQPGD